MDGRQLLGEFIAARTSQAQFARDVGCSDSHLSLILKGERGVSLRLAKRISEATDGAVPMDALVKEEQPPVSAVG